MPPIEKEKRIRLQNILIDNSPEFYSPPGELIRAAEVAYALKKPLLISGEPGTGKTDFALWAAASLCGTNGFSGEPLIYNTKSTSVAQDLFYFYDVVAHFKGNTISKTRGSDQGTEEFIKLKYLGLAFADAIGRLAPKDEKGITGYRINQVIARNSGVVEKPRGTVVLIDEVDKAQRDFPNDLLNELDKFEYEIKELNEKVRLQKEEKERLLVIMTTNIERNLPEPFLRRCIYYHIPFPDKDRMFEIISKRLKLEEADSQTKAELAKRIKDFFVLREEPSVQKKPSTSEAVEYISTLLADKALGLGLFDAAGKVTGDSLQYLATLLKKREDRELFIPSTR